jgi:murein L,D-transpeptidase YcbB/YkuD
LTALIVMACSSFLLAACLWSNVGATGRKGYGADFSCGEAENSAPACGDCAFIHARQSKLVAQRLPIAIDVRGFLRAAIVVGSVLMLAWPAIAQQRETDAERDLREFYETTGQHTVWIDEHGRPTLDAQRVLARLRDVAEDGLEPGAYRVDELGRQAMALDAGEPFSAVDAAAFDVGMTASVLKYFRHLHLGRVSPRALGFHLDHAIEPHDFPQHLRSALSGHAFDRVVEELRPAFAQYGGLRSALAAYRGRDTARARQIELALERLRWLPDVNGERLLVVNIPMFYLWGWEAGRGDGIPSIGMAAVTGRARATKTPVFASTITSVVFNPDWTVPESILRNEILPAIAANPNYLVQHHMEMTGSGSTRRVRQLPGPWNALGPIKFMLPNIHGVYLHGTPAPALFKEARRDFSHGCVRVEDPFALAAWVLKDEPDWSLDRIRDAVADGATRSINVGRPPRVVLFYMTAAFVPKDGSVQFADDVYGHDARLDAWLQAQSDGGDQ